MEKIKAMLPVPPVSYQMFLGSRIRLVQITPCDDADRQMDSKGIDAVSNFRRRRTKHSCQTISNDCQDSNCMIVAVIYYMYCTTADGAVNIIATCIPVSTPYLFSKDLFSYNIDSVPEITKVMISSLH